MPGLSVKIYDCHVTGVRPDDRVIDVQSRNGTPFKNVSYLLPWISAIGSGIDVVPRTGDKCLVLATPVKRGEKGRMVLCIGFEVPIGVGSDGLQLGSRLQGLPQGSIALRAVSDDGNEAHLILTRGGSALIGANDVCRTIYSPIDDSIINIFNNWELNGPGGFVKWMREDGSEAVTYEAEYRTLVDEDQPGPRVNVRVGGEGDDSMAMTVSTGGGADPFLRVRVDSNGEAFIEGESLNVHGRASVDIDAPAVTIKKRQVLGQGDPI